MLTPEQEKIDLAFSLLADTAPTFYHAYTLWGLATENRQVSAEQTKAFARDILEKWAHIFDPLETHPNRFEAKELAKHCDWWGWEPVEEEGGCDVDA